MSKTVKCVIQRKPEILHQDATLLDVAQLMAVNNVGVIPIFSDQDQNNCIGVVTDRDVVVRGLAAGNDLSCKVSEVMTKGVLQSIDANEDILAAANLMKEKKVRRLLVTENNKFVGLISLGDLCVSSHRADTEKAVMDALCSISSCPSNQ